MAQRILTPERSDERLAMTYDEFVAWMDEDTRAEWIDGEVIVFMPAKPRHQHLVFFLARLVAEYVDLRRLGLVMISPFQMRLHPARSSREPDIAFLANDHLDRIAEGRVEGPADLVIEVISDDSVTRDRRDKLLEYQRAGIPEYWIVDAREGRNLFEPFFLTEREVYQLIQPDKDGRTHSAVLPGFWIDPTWLWQDPLPHPLSTAAKIAPDIVAELVRRLQAETS